MRAGWRATASHRALARCECVCVFPPRPPSRTGHADSARASTQRAYRTSREGPDISVALMHWFDLKAEACV
jgi:hypothetical protein